MDLIAQLSTILREKFVQQRRDRRGSVTLQDSQSDMEVKLVRVPMPFLSIPMSHEPIRGKRTNLDPSHLPALQDRGDLKKICDYLLIGQSNGRYYAVFVELKTTLGERTEAKGKEQLLRSLPILDYLLSVCAAESGGGEKSNLTIRYALIATKEHSKIYKRRSQHGQRGQLRKETYKSIQVTIFVEPTVHLTALARG